jgi:hypothetical protein
MLPETTSYPKDCIFKWISLMKTASKLSEQFSHTVLIVIPSIFNLSSAAKKAFVSHFVYFK